MPDTPQTYQTHVRWHAPFHFVAGPLAIINFFWSLWNLWQHFGSATIKDLIVAIILLVAVTLTRTSALKAQDRVIRLEEELRYQKILSPELVSRAKALKPWQFIALRFASDAELPELMKQTLDGKFAKAKDLKLAIKNWRGDYLRV